MLGWIIIIIIIVFFSFIFLGVMISLAYGYLPGSLDLIFIISFLRTIIHVLVFSAIGLLLPHALLWIYQVWQGNVFFFFSLPHFSCDNDVGIIHQKRERNYGCGIIMIKGHGCSLHWCLRRNIKGLRLKCQKRATLVWQPSFCWYNNIHYLIQTYWRSI